ncbi:MAG: copper resistance protein B [Verrucomicrobia bacterium]|nr:copper resistance protein B [Verrucomicrobiota bacterium]
MKTFVSFSGTIAFLLASSVSALAADSEHSGHASGLGKTLPPGWEPAVHDQAINTFTFFQKAEFRSGDAPDAAVVDAEGWIGGDYQRLWWKADGEQETKGAKAGEIELQALYSRLFSPFWDFQTGIRIDRQYSGRKRDTTGYFVVGLEGLAPYWFEVEPVLFVSEKGKVSSRVTASYDQLITQRWVIQPRIDLNAAFQKDTRRNVGTGLNDIEVGLRLRYDFRRQFSPYVGVTWRRALGNTADLVRRTGEDISATSVVFGLRTWF